MNEKQFDFQKAKQDGTEFAIVVVISGEPASFYFDNLAAARKIFPELDPYKNTRLYTWGMFDGFWLGKPVMRFEDWETDRRMSV